MAEREFIVSMKNGKPHLKCPSEKDENGNIKVFVPNLSEVNKIVAEKVIKDMVDKAIKENGKRNI